MSRQEERRQRFDAAFAGMPLWETWSEDRPKLTDAEYSNACYNAREILERELRTVNHCKLVPRRIRRDMARTRSLREFRAARGLLETIPPKITFTIPINGV